MPIDFSRLPNQPTEEELEELQDESIQPSPDPSINFPQVVQEAGQEAIQQLFEPQTLPFTDVTPGQLLKKAAQIPEVEIQGQPPLLEQLRLATQERPGEELTSTQRRQIGQEAAIRTIADIIDITPAGLVIAQNIPALGKLIGRIPIGQSTLGKLVSTPVGPKTFTNIIRKFKGQPVVGTFKGDPSKVIEAQFKVEEIRTNPIARDAFIRDQQEAAGLIRKPKGLLPSPEEVTRIDTIKLPTQKLAIQQTISDIKLNFPQASIIVKRTTELGLNKKDITPLINQLEKQPDLSQEEIDKFIINALEQKAKPPFEPKIINIFEPQPLKPSQVKAQIRQITGQVTPEKPTITEKQALKRSLKRQEQVARRAAIQEKNRQQEIQRLVKGIQRLPIEEMNFEEKAQIEILKQELTTTRTLDGLRDLYDKTVLLKDIGKQKFIETKSAKDTQFNLERDLVIKTIQGGDPPKPPVPITNAQAPDPSRKISVSKRFKGKILRPTRIMDSLDHQQNFQGPLHKATYDRVNLARDQELRQIDKSTNQVVELQQRFGLSNKKLGEIRIFEGIKTTLDEAIGYYMVRDNIENVAALVLGNKLPSSFIMSAINSLTPSEKAYGDGLLSILKSRFPKVRETFIDIKDGKEDLLQIRGGYLPMVRENTDFGTTLDEIADEFIQRKVLSKRSIRRPFTKERKKIPAEAQKPIRTGATNLVTDHIAKREKFIAMAPVVRDIQRLFNDKLFRKAIRDTGHPEYLDELQTWINNIASPNIYRLQTQGAKAIQILRQNSAIDFIGTKMKTILKQTPSFFLALREVGPEYLLGGTAQYTTNPIKWNKFIDERAPQIKNRMINRTIEEFKLKSPNQWRQIQQRVGQVTMTGIRTMDAIVVRSIWLGKYNQMISEGAAESEAINEATKTVLRTQPAADPKDIPSIFSEDSVALFVQFQNQTNQIFNIITYDIPADFTAGRFEQGIMGSIGIALDMLAIWMITNARVPKDKEDLLDLVLDQSQLVTLIGPLINGSRKGFDGLPPGLQAFKKTGEFVSALARGKLTNAGERALEAAGVALGFPVSQPRRTIKGATRLIKGETTDFRELIFSQFVLEQGSDKSKEKLKKREDKKRVKALIKARRKGDNLSVFLLERGLISG